MSRTPNKRHLTKAFVKLKEFQALRDGRDLHILLELFKYITENPEPSQRLLDKLKFTDTKKSKLIKGLVL